jgi:hypothetical protein
MSNKDRRTACTNLISAAQEKLIKILLDQFNDIFAEHQRIMTGAWKENNDPVAKLLVGKRNHTIPIKNHNRFNKMPKDIKQSMRAEVIDELTNAVKEILLDLENAQDVFLAYHVSEKRGGEIPKVISEQFEQLKKMTKSGWEQYREDLKRFDIQASRQHAAILLFESEIAKIDSRGGGKGDENAGSEVAPREMNELAKSLEQENLA